MIFQSFLLGNLVSLCMKIINSVVVVGLYYGFLTTFSIGPSYLFLLRAQVMEEGTEKKVSATTGFITGQLMMFISIYYAPMHLALGRPHTITVLALPYLLFHFFWNNNKHFGSTTRNSMRNLSIQCVFLNNLILQLFNHFILPSSMLARLVNIYLFRCNNKMLFLTSSFLGWLIGHILFMKWLGLVLVWIRQNKSIRSNVLIRSNKYLVSKLRNSMDRIWSILLFITCVYYLGRMPSPILTKKLKETSKTEERVESEEERVESEEERDVEIETASEMRGMKQEQEGSTFDENKDFLGFCFENPFITLLFDYNRWNRPSRYIKNNQFEMAVRNQMSQYFFDDICKSDGEQRISFTYPPSLSTFFEILKKKISLSTLEPFFQLDNRWVFINKQKRNNLNNEFQNRIEALDNKSFFLDRIETRTRLCNDNTKQEYLPIMYDPFLNGAYRGTIKKRFSFSIMTSIENFKKRVGINRIHSILLLYTDSEELINEIRTSANDQNKDIRIKEITKKVPHWSYKLITEVEQEMGEYQEDMPVDHEIRSRKATRVVVFTNTTQNIDPDNTNTETSDPTQVEEFALIRYAKQSDFRRDIIKGSIRAQRRKMVIFKLFQANAHSPLFLDRIKKFFLFSLFDDIFELMKPLFQNRIKEVAEVQIGEYAAEQTKRKEKKRREIDELKERIQIERERVQIEIAAAWDNLSNGQRIRSYLLITQSILRKYLILPSLIIAKNIGRILLFQPSEWKEDFQELNREIHVKCTYDGVQLSETEFPQNWETEGMQIKILFPFYLKPWKGSKSTRDRMKKKYDDFYFLTTFGMVTEFPFGPPRERPLFFDFFEPILKELNKKMEQSLTILKGKTKRKVLIEITKWKNVPFLKKLIKELNSIGLFKFRLKEVYESNETQKEKDSMIRNKRIDESFSPIQSPAWSNDSPTKKKIKNMTNRINLIRNQIESITKEKNLNKRSDNPKKLDSLKNIWTIVKRRNARLTYKFHYFRKLCIVWIQIILRSILLNCIEQIRTKIQNFLNLIHFCKWIGQSFFLLIQKKMNQQNPNKSCFISTIKKSLDIVSKQNSYILSDLSYLSQAYVFYRLSQTQVRKLYKLKDVLQYQGTSLFLKTEIKDFFEKQGILQKQKISQTELDHKKRDSYAMNDWKKWLRGHGHSQYDLSQIRWYRLIPPRWRDRIKQRCITKKKEKWEKDQFNFYRKQNNSNEKWEKDPFINFYRKQNDSIVSIHRASGWASLMTKEVYSLFNDNFIKYNRYELFSYKYLNYEFRLEGNKNQELFDNSNIYKDNLYDLLESTLLNRYLVNLYIEKNADRKYFDWKILKFSLKKKADLKTWIQISQGTKMGTNNYQIIDFEKFEKKYLFYFRIPQDKKQNSKNITTNLKRVFFDWMGMNEEIVNHPIPNLELWLFPEFLQLYIGYKKKPWIIPSKFLLLNSNQNENIGTSTINEKQKKNENKEEPVGQGNLGSVLSNQQKGIEEYDAEGIEKKDAESYIKRPKKKKQSKAEAEMDLFLNHYFFFQFQWGDNSVSQRILDNINTYCFLLRLNNLRKITISSIHREELCLDLMMFDENFPFTKLMETSLFFIEPTRVSIKNDGQFLMYQTISIFLIHKSKHKTSNQRYHEQVYIDKTHFNESILEYQKIIKNRDQNDFDLLIPENILSSRRRRELRILICFNSKTKSGEDTDRNPVCYNENWGKNMRDKKKLIQFKFFLWPNYRLEDLACMNRYWFNTNNGSRFSMLRIHMYPRLKSSIFLLP